MKTVAFEDAIHIKIDFGRGGQTVIHHTIPEIVPVYVDLQGLQKGFLFLDTSSCNSFHEDGI